MTTLSAPRPDAFAPPLFDPETYFRLDPATGTMTTRGGAKCCTLAEPFFRGLYLTLRDECGPAWTIALRRCGETWGARQADRFLREIAEATGRGLDEMPMSEFDRLLGECFAAHGWGRVRADYSAADAGIVQVEVRNSIVACALHDAGAHVDALLEGVLKVLYSKTSGRDLECFETECAAAGASRCRFVVGLPARLEPVPKWREEGLGHAEIVRRLMKS